MSNRRRTKPMKFVSYLELSDDADELLEFLSQSESLEAQAEAELKLRRHEKQLIKDRLKKARLDQTELRISDHAVVRYLERVVGMDINACKEEMLKQLPTTIERSEKPVIVTLSRDNNLHYVIRDHLIISVTPLRELEDSATPHLSATSNTPATLNLYDTPKPTTNNTGRV